MRATYKFRARPDLPQPVEGCVLSRGVEVIHMDYQELVQVLLGVKHGLDVFTMDDSLILSYVFPPNVSLECSYML
jgi:hypothetical protein